MRNIDYNIFKYDALGEKDLEKTINDLVNHCEEPRHFVLYTGWLGMMTFDYSMMEIDISCLTKYWITQEKRSTQFSFVTKHGMYKARLNHKGLKLDVYYGTNYLFSCTHLIDVDTYLKKQNNKK